MPIYEILVPTTRNDGKYFTIRHHKIWDEHILKIAGGLTIIAPQKGKWVSNDKKLFAERMIPVKIVCTSEEIEKIADITAKHYEQLAVLFYKISDEVTIKHYADSGRTRRN